MGLPESSPISDLFQGTIYMTLGCSRSPVTVAVPNSNRSAAVDLPPCAVPAGACAPGAAPPEEWAVDGRGAGAWAGCAAGAGAASEVMARGSPASLWALDGVFWEGEAPEDGVLD